MFIFRRLTLCVIAILFCGIMSESLFLRDISQKLDYIINELKEKDHLNCCELPEDKNVIPTVIGLKLYEKPKYIRKDFYANFRCKDPASFMLLGGPTNRRCYGTDDDRIVNRECVLLKNETQWQVAMLQLDSDRNLCYNGSSNSSDLIKDPLSPNSYFQCVLETRSKSYKFVSKPCGYQRYFDYVVKDCISDLKPYLQEFIEAAFKPSIVVHATDSSWDSMGWLLVQRGSKVTIDCVYPKVAATNVTWYKTDFDVTNVYYGVQISGHWISDYRNSIVLNDVDYTDTGIYTCQGEYYKLDGVSRRLYPETHSHAVTIALKEKWCSETPLPDFELHHKYYRDYPFMNHVKRRCQNMPELSSV